MLAFAIDRTGVARLDVDRLHQRTRILPGVGIGAAIDRIKSDLTNQRRRSPIAKLATARSRPVFSLQIALKPDVLPQGNDRLQIGDALRVSAVGFEPA